MVKESGANQHTRNRRRGGQLIEMALLLGLMAVMAVSLVGAFGIKLSDVVAGINGQFEQVEVHASDGSAGEGADEADEIVRPRATVRTRARVP